MRKLRLLLERLARHMTNRKVVLFIVEGPSDDEALSLFLTRIFSKFQVHIEIAHCDLTTDGNVDRTTILMRLGKVIDNVRSQYKWKKSDFQQIIHLVDMDGAYISDNDVVDDSAAHSPLYSLTEIRTKYPDRIKNRNKQKRGCLDRISTTSTVSGIPYQVYFMSCNLDHVLYNKLNSTANDKKEDSKNFARKYKDDLLGFKDYICNSSFSLNMKYTESWSFIKKEKHSLERFSNFCICINRACNDEPVNDYKNQKYGGR